MPHNVALAALQSGMCLELQYDGYSRLVEVHAVGESKKGNICMRVFQVDGGSVSGETTGTAYAPARRLPAKVKVRALQCLTDWGSRIAR